MGNDTALAGSSIVDKADSNLRQRLVRESGFFFGLLFFGIAILPYGIYLVGQLVFGEYGGSGYGDFFGTIAAKLGGAEPVAWFLVLSPYLTWQIIRLALRAWRSLGGTA